MMVQITHIKIAQGPSIECDQSRCTSFGGDPRGVYTVIRDDEGAEKPLERKIQRVMGYRKMTLLSHPI